MKRRTNLKDSTRVEVSMILLQLRRLIYPRQTPKTLIIKLEGLTRDLQAKSEAAYADKIARLEIIE